jgi:tetratricopeptide (TPR) repeat protein
VNCHPYGSLALRFVLLLLGVADNNSEPFCAGTVSSSKRGLARFVICTEGMTGLNRRPRIKMTRWKKAGYGCLTTVMICLLVEAMLFVLRVEPLITNEDPFVGFESTTPLFVQDSTTGASQRSTAQNRLSYFNPQSFSAEKDPDSFRIFCLGGSTTYGRPYDDQTSYVGWLREFLPLADGRRNYEVINAGGISYASYRVASLMDELCRYQPDLFVVYTGHNEFLEQRTYQDLRSMPASERGLRRVLAHSRSYSLLRSWLHSNGPEDVRTILPSEVDAILDHSIGPESYERSMLQRPQVLRHLAFNLARIIDTAHAVKARVVIVSPAANLKDFSPFKSQHRRGLTSEQLTKWNTLFELGTAYQNDGKDEQAVAEFRAAEAIDDQFAKLHYRIGRSLYSLHHWEEASNAFQRAVDEDVCPLRVTNSIRQMIDRTAVAREIPLIDFPAILEEKNQDAFGHSVLGRELFLDHVHPTVAANRLLAFSLVEALRQMGTIPNSSPRWSAGEIKDVVNRVEKTVDAESQAVSLRNLAQVLGWAGKKSEAGPLALKAVALREAANLPDDPEALFYAAVYQATRGENPSAIQKLERLLHHQPDHWPARWRLAFLYFQAEDFLRANDHYRAALKARALNDESKYHFALTMTKLGEFGDATALLQDLADSSPSYDIVLALAEALEGHGRFVRAIEAYQWASEYRPDAITPRHLLARLFAGRGDPTQAVKWYLSILKIDPNLNHIQEELDKVEESAAGRR